MTQCERTHQTWQPQLRDSRRELQPEVRNVLKANQMVSGHQLGPLKVCITLLHFSCVASFRKEYLKVYLPL